MKKPPLKERKRIAQVFRDRARRFMRNPGEFGVCIALNYDPTCIKLFERIFKRDAYSSTRNPGYYMRYSHENYSDIEVRERRMNAMLLAAEMIEDGTVYELDKK